MDGRACTNKGKHIQLLEGGTTLEAYGPSRRITELSGRGRVRYVLNRPKIRKQPGHEEVTKNQGSME